MHFKQLTTDTTPLFSAQAHNAHFLVLPSDGGVQLHVYLNLPVKLSADEAIAGDSLVGFGGVDMLIFNIKLGRTMISVAVNAGDPALKTLLQQAAQLGNLTHVVHTPNGMSIKVMQPFSLSPSQEQMLDLALANNTQVEKFVEAYAISLAMGVPVQMVSRLPCVGSTVKQVYCALVDPHAQAGAVPCPRPDEAMAQKTSLH